MDRFKEPSCWECDDRGCPECREDLEPRNTYKFKHKNRLYLIRVNPDIAVHGGRYGKGTTTYINPLQADGETVIPEMRGFQGRHSKAAIIRVIEKNWSKK